MRQNRSAPARTTTLLAMKKTELNPIEVKQNMKKTNSTFNKRNNVIVEILEKVLTWTFVVNMIILGCYKYNLETAVITSLTIVVLVDISTKQVIY